LIWPTCVQNLTALSSAIPEIWMGPPKFKMGHMMLPCPFHEHVRVLGLAMTNLFTKFDISMMTHFKYMKGDEKCNKKLSYCNAFVSRNPANTKHSI